MPQLVLEWTEGDELRICPIEADRMISIGRDASCDVVLDDATVSRVHALVYLRRGDAIVRHRSVTNPTYVNGALMVGESTLHDGDELWLPVRAVCVRSRDDVRTVEEDESP